MSKMPAKKKSCFQITSVTQAQVAASSITDDTESLDDPDESRTEDVSSEIFDVSRADYDHEVGDISSSEETLNNVSESETASSVLKSQVPQDVHATPVTGPPNGGIAYRNTGAVHANAHVGGNMPATTYAAATQQHTVSTNASLSHSTQHVPPVVPSSTTASCSSRFRVIKLDHGTGEPFKRGRWTCTEFYDKESSESSASRTADSSKHVVTLDHSLDRDAGGSVATHSETASESGYVSAPQGDAQPQSYGMAHQSFGGVSQSLTPLAQNGLQQGQTISINTQKSPSMPPTHPQQFPYSSSQQQQQHPISHNLPSSVMPLAQPDYRQQQPQSTVVAQPPGTNSTSTTSHTLPVASLSAGVPLNQGPSPVMPPAGVPLHMLGLVTHGGDAVSGSSVAGSLPSGQPAPAQGHSHQQSSIVGGGVLTAGVSSQLQQSAAGGMHVQTQSTAQASGQTAAVIPNILSGKTGNVPQTLPGQGGNMPLVTGSATIQTQTLRPVVPPSEETRRRSESLPQSSSVLSKDTVKSGIPDGLTLGAPVVNSLFGIPITIDGDEDR